MELGIIVAVAVLFGGLSLGLLWAEKNSESVDTAAREVCAAQNEKELENADVNSRILGKLWVLGIFAINTTMSVFRFVYYGASVANITNLTLLCSILWACAWIDCREFRIPNRFLVIGSVLRCVLLVIEGFIEPGEIKYTLLRCAVAAIALLIVALLCRLVISGGIGMGDVKLLVLVAFFLGTDGVWNVMFCSIVAAFVASLYLVLTKKATPKTEIPFAPFLLVGTIAASFLMNF